MGMGVRTRCASGLEIQKKKLDAEEITLATKSPVNAAHRMEAQARQFTLERVEIICIKE